MGDCWHGECWVPCASLKARVPHLPAEVGSAQEPGPLTGSLLRKRPPRTVVPRLVVSGLLVVVSALVATGATLHADGVVFGWFTQFDRAVLVHAVARTVVMGG